MVSNNMLVNVEVFVIVFLRHSVTRVEIRNTMKKNNPYNKRENILKKLS
jgi:hypothetical protein